MRQPKEIELQHLYDSQNLTYKDLTNMLKDFEYAAARTKRNVNSFYFLVTQRQDLSGAPWQIIARSKK